VRGWTVPEGEHHNPAMVDDADRRMEDLYHVIRK
jgi:hypothetical protein